MAKVKYNLKNVHLAPRTETEVGVSYETPIAFPGAKSISLDPQGEIVKFYADGVVYWQAASNNGYEGDLEMALFTDEIREKVLAEIKDAAGVIFENASNLPKSFALLFEIDTDEKGYRFCFYNCTMTRPSTGSETTEETIEPGTESASISCAPEADGIVRARTTADTDETVYNNWYKAVYIKTDQEAA